MKKILILSVTAGEGHNAAAKAMCSYFWEHDAECDILDTYGSVSPTVAKSLNKGYLWVSSRAKTAYRVGYRLAEMHKNSILDDAVGQITQHPFAEEIAAHIRESEPDAVVFTHPFSGVILDSLKRSGRVAPPTVGILTDFIFHPFWERCTANDYVVTPAAALRAQAARKGFRPAQVLPLGIPIRPCFARSTPRSEARRALGLDPDAATVLLMGGSMGYGSMTDTVRALDALPLDGEAQLIAVCGRNRRAYAEISSLPTRRRLLTLGFTDNVDELMDASDCIVTKPGGLTTSEALAKRLPMVIVNPIPGQEARNTEFLLNSGTAVAANAHCTAAELVERLLTEPGRMEAMRLCIDALRRPDATRDVCEFVLSLPTPAR